MKNIGESLIFLHLFAMIRLLFLVDISIYPHIFPQPVDFFIHLSLYCELNVPHVLIAYYYFFCITLHAIFHIFYRS
ncbi:hypothetical protein CULT_450002 [[Clostridium] ultunense Esp]|nr:hypothetical protein CULT_450002 [[Clostridium] ultunense Esp]